MVSEVVSQQPTLKGTDKILFPANTDAKRVSRIKCPSCTFNIACTGPKNAGGDTFADLHTRKNITQAAIKTDANCFKQD